MRKMESSPSDSRLFRLTLIGFLLLSLIDSLNPVHGFLFGSAGGGGCSCPQPVCQPSLPQPTCCSAPVQSCGSSSSNGVGAIIVNCNGGSSGSGCGGGGGGGGCGGGCSSGGGGGGCSGGGGGGGCSSGGGGGGCSGGGGGGGCSGGECGGGCSSAGGGGGCSGGGGGGGCSSAGGGGGCSGGGGGGSECAGGCSAVVESQYASAGSGGGGGYASQPISNGYAQSKGTGYAQPSVGGYAQQGYAQQGNNDKGYQSASEGGYSQQQQQQGGGGYRAQQGPAPVQPPPSYQSQAQPEPQPEPQPAAPEPSHQEVQPAANEAENYSGGSETEAGVAAAAGDRLQEVQEEDAVVERINTETTDLKKTTLPFTTTSTATITASIQIQKGIGGEQHSDVFIEPIDISQLKLTNDTECNSEELRTIIIENLLADDLNLAKRTIQLQAETRFGGRFDVVCSHHDFSYITNTELWCQETRDNTSCYAYRQLGY